MLFFLDTDMKDTPVYGLRDTVALTAESKAMLAVSESTTILLVSSHAKQASKITLIPHRLSF